MSVVEKIRRHISCRANLDKHVALIADSKLFDLPFYNRSSGRTFESEADAVRHYLLKGDQDGANPNPLFDGDWYRKRYPDIAGSGVAPFLHYILHGAAEHRDPHPLFYAAYYVDRLDAPGGIANPLHHFLHVDTDPARSPHPLFDGRLYAVRSANHAAARPALIHFLENGRANDRAFHLLFDAALYRRDAGHRANGNVLVDFLRGPPLARTHMLFDPAFYLQTNEDLAEIEMHPLVHYVLHGSAERRSPHPVFDQIWYLDRYPEALLSDESALGYFVREGRARGDRPNRYFDADWYAATYALEIGGRLAPLEHYLAIGLQRDYRPSLEFDPAYYLDVNPDVRAAGIPAFAHFMQFGRIEQRRFRPPPPAVGGGAPEGAPCVNLIGPLLFLNGLGRSARAYLALLQQSHVAVNAINWERGFGRLLRLDIELPSTETRATINIVHLNLDLLLADGCLDNGPLAELMASAERNILIFYWELSELKREWVPLLSRFDEVWCPTIFIRDAVRAASDVPTRLLRPALDVTAHQPKRGAKRETFGIPASGFVFAYFADGGSVMTRKNPGALVRAFLEEFDEGEQAFCFIKIHYSGEASADIEHLAALIGARRDIVVARHLYDDEEMLALLQSIDCYVSPHRSEGLGLTIIEAMQNGVPVIATPYGGARDIVDAAHAYPLDYMLSEVGPGCEPYPEDLVWADPSIASIRKAMRAVFTDRAAAARKAEAARAAVARLIAENRSAAEAIFASALKRDA